MSRYHLTKGEMETLINYDEDSDRANIYTYDQKLIHKLDGLVKKYPDQFICKSKGPFRSGIYEVPKKCVSVRPPYSEKRRNQQIMDAKVNGSPFAEMEDKDDE
ncbi:MAG: immunoglobulin [Eubacteriales bacterium]|nr:immunoglobulin [Eubacteriales bacterium]